jgi:hypothetical protein
MISPSGFCIKHGYKFSNFFLKSWILEGSMDNQNWVLLKEVKEVCFSKPFDVCYFDLDCIDQFFVFFKITSKDKNSFGKNHLVLGGFELFGILKN